MHGLSEQFAEFLVWRAAATASAAAASANADAPMSECALGRCDPMFAIDSAFMRRVLAEELTPCLAFACTSIVRIAPR